SAHEILNGGSRKVCCQYTSIPGRPPSSDTTHRSRPSCPAPRQGVPGARPYPNRRNNGTPPPPRAGGCPGAPRPPSSRPQPHPPPVERGGGPGRHQRLDLGGDPERPPVGRERVVKRLLAGAIARQQQPPVRAVPQPEREHPVEPLHHLVAPLLVAVDDRLGVG